ncbi:pitrilysin family protein [Thalassoglobus sp. JC818]|uniref:M16 family metallopeptidase n=1 Tax=Thalassoglobus sp. JC818 TaxID=3232136 RepID=UPI00345A95B4
MHKQSIQVHQLDNGLTLLIEQMKHVQSAAFTLMTPAGVAYEPNGKNGTAAAALDLMTRGAGGRSSREITAALDSLGVQGNDSAGWNFLSFSGAALAENVAEAIPIYAKILREPLLPEDQFLAVINGTLQSLLAIEDDPQRKVFVELRKLCYDAPWGRPSDGTLDDIRSLTYDDLVSHVQQKVRPNGALIGVAGNVDPVRIQETIEACFADWEALPEPQFEVTPAANGIHHIDHESTQTHIGLAFPGVQYGSPDYLTAWAAVSILSGGSSSRLFTEVREKRGLCYSVYATLNSLLTEGRVLAYAGTTTERAQETLDVMMTEIRKLGDGIEDAELRRCKARAKSALIMQQESTGARASSIARDWFHLHRVKTLEEIHSEVEAITVEQIQDFLKRHPLENPTLLTIGAKPLELKS